MLIENKVLIELKTVKFITPQHEGQIINYLSATGINVGLIIRFGSPKLEFKRFARNRSD